MLKEHSSKLNQMKFQNYAIAILLISLIASCKKNILIENYFDRNASFTLMAKTLNSAKMFRIETKEISPQSKAYVMLNEWIKSNKSGWESTPARYQARTSLYQKNFQLLYLVTADAVVISFKDEEGKQQQYIKSITKGELDFLADSIN